jgi:cobalt/nickel transport system permease protein
VAVTAVLIVQCFLFQDGGVIALGANVFNMAIIGAAGGGTVYRLLCRCLPGERGRVTAIAFAGWFSTVAASIACAGQLAWSGMFSWTAGFTAMAGVHMLVGLGEGLISALVFLAIQRTRPDMISESRWGGRNRGPQVSSGDRLASTPAPPGGNAAYGELLGFGLLVALGLAIFVAPFACPWPDGLESVAVRLGFEHHATPPLPAPAPGYSIPGMSWAAGATALAGGVGTLVVFGFALLLGRVLVPDQRKADHEL